MVLILFLTFTAVTCNNPGQVPNAQQFPASGPYSCLGQITYTCNPNYQLQGSGSLTCGPNGQWSGPLPTCQAVSKCTPDDLLPEVFGF